MSMWLAVSGGGEMTQADMLTDLTRDRVCPVMTYMKGEKQIVPLFNYYEVALQFAKRNSADPSSIGVMEVDERDRDRLLKDGLDFETLEWPNKRDILIHVLFLDQEVRTYSALPPKW